MSKRAKNTLLAAVAIALLLAFGYVLNPVKCLLDDTRIKEDGLICWAYAIDQMGDDDYGYGERRLSVLKKQGDFEDYYFCESYRGIDPEYHFLGGEFQFALFVSVVLIVVSIVRMLSRRLSPSSDGVWPAMSVFDYGPGSEIRRFVALGAWPLCFVCLTLCLIVQEKADILRWASHELILLAMMLIVSMCLLVLLLWQWWRDGNGWRLLGEAISWGVIAFVLVVILFGGVLFRYYASVVALGVFLLVGYVAQWFDRCLSRRTFRSKWLLRTLQIVLSLALSLLEIVGVVCAYGIYV